MTIQIGINGFGRIGRNVLRAALNDPEIRIVAVNDLTDAGTLAHLLKHDSVLGNLDAPVSAGGDFIAVDQRRIHVFSERDPARIDWGSVGAEIIIESTGLFKKREDAARHLRGPVRKVVITAPAKNEDFTVVIGVNEGDYDPRRHHVVSNASCTTNCLAPIAKVLHKTFTIEMGQMTTVHAYTNDQSLLDQPHKDLRRARAAALSIIPTTTGAARSVGLVLPELEARLDGISLRVPTPNVSVVDLVVVVGHDTTKEAVNTALRQAAEGFLSGIVRYSEEPLVSSDFRGDPHSAIFDASCTNVVASRLVKVFAWYDNEWGYSCRVVDLIRLMAARGL